METVLSQHFAMAYHKGELIKTIKGMVAMNKASILCIALMGGFTGAVCAASDSEIPIEHYSYAMKLDVAKVISISEAQDVCGAVPEHMIYEDSKGGQARSGVSGDGRWLRRRITIWAHA